MRRWPRIIFSGICQCGHSWHKHHLQMILNQDALDELEPEEPPYFPGPCLVYGFNETAGLGADGKPHCFGYKEEKP